MTRKQVLDHIEQENRSHGSVESQKTVAEYFLDNGIAEHHGRERRTSEIEDEIGQDIDHDVGLCLKHLEAAEVVSEHGGNSTYIHHERTDEWFFGGPGGEKFTRLLRTETERLCDDLEPVECVDSSDRSVEGDDKTDEKTRRTTVAEALSDSGSIDVAPDPSGVEAAFDTTVDDVSRMERLDVAVRAIEEHDEVEKTDEYGRMGWRNAANKWAMTEEWYKQATNHSLSDFGAGQSPAAGSD
jgi:hypothetical protein